MAADWFIYFDGDDAKAPTKDEIGSLLRNFFGEAATEIKWDRDRWYVILHGHCTFPFAEVAPDVPNPFGDGDEKRERWIEVWLDKKDGTVDVMTRMQDRYTNALAAELAEMIARFWHGRQDDDESLQRREDERAAKYLRSLYDDCKDFMADDPQGYLLCADQVLLIGEQVYNVDEDGD